MDIELKKWGNSLGLRIPHKLAQSFGLDENTLVELSEVDDTLVIRKKPTSITLDELLDSIPDGFTYPEDVEDFVGGKPAGQEII